MARAISDFCCLGAGDEDDPVAQNVHSFLTDRRFEPGIEHGISATYLLIDQEKDPAILGYATLTLDSVRLTNTEKKKMESLVGIADFGAVRIQMIGVDHRHQRCGCGNELLEGITGLARRLSEHVAVRFILADANRRKVDWSRTRASFRIRRNERSSGWRSRNAASLCASTSPIRPNHCSAQPLIFTEKVRFAERPSVSATLTFTRIWPFLPRFRARCAEAGRATRIGFVDSAPSRPFGVALPL